MLILTFSYFWVLVSIFGPVLGAKHPSRAAVNRDTNTNTIEVCKPSRMYDKDKEYKLHWRVGIPSEIIESLSVQDTSKTL